MTGIHECWRWFHDAFSLNRSEWAQTWMTHWPPTLAGSCFIYESRWFSATCLRGRVIHEWSRQPEPAFVELHWEKWIFRINFFHFRLLFPTPIESISLLLSIYDEVPIFIFNSVKHNYLSTAWLMVWTWWWSDPSDISYICDCCW